MARQSLGGKPFPGRAGRLVIPDGADIPRFLLSDGKISQKLTPKKVVTLENLMTAYFDSLPAGAIEESTIQGMRIHERHLCRLLARPSRFRV